MAEVRPYSYHTFLLPFELISLNTREKPLKEVLNQRYWQELTEDNYLSFNSVVLRENEEPERENIIQAIKYNQDQYFHENVKKAIHNDGTGNIVSEYVFRFHDKNADKLVIRKSNEDEKENEKEYIIQSNDNTYVLKVSNIRLKIFNTGIGMLILELYNDLYTHFASVKEINELGRRISLPYIARDSGNIACAQSIKWNFLYHDTKSYSFKDKNDSFLKGEYPVEKIYMLDFLENIIIDKDYRSEHRLKPSLDDRMFTCCLVQNNELSNNFKMDYLAESEKNSEVYKDISKSLYEYVYIDKEGSCTAASYTFRKNILMESLYHRWTEWGTIYGVSHASLVAITDEGEFLETIITRPFLTQYVEIAILVLVQRASILRFQKQTGGNLNNSMIQELQSRYINYRNQLHFFEVSSQEQGIELYELIRKQLYIEKEMEVLEKNLEILYEKSNVDNSNKFNIFGVIIGCIAIMSIVLDLMSFIVTVKAENSFFTQLHLLSYELSGIVFLTIVITGILYLWINRK